MKKGQGKREVEPHLVLDAVKHHLGVETDKELASRLGMLPSGVSKLRKRIHGSHNGVPAEWVIAIHKVTHWPIDRIELLCKEAVYG